MRTVFLRCGLAVGLVLLVPMLGYSQTGELRLDSLIAEAQRVNPDLAAARLRYEAFEAKVPRAGSLPDPILKATLSNLPTHTWELDQTPMSGIEFMFTQRIPFPGKLGLKRSAARSLAGRAEKEYESAREFVIGELKRGYYQLYLLEESIQITQRNKDLLRDFAQIASTRYSVGKGLQQDVLKAQVEVSKMTDKLITLQEAKSVAQARINVLLNRSPQDPLGRPQDLVFRKMELTEKQLQDLALDSNPALLGMAFSVKASESSYRLARREYLPDFTLSVSYRMRDEVKMDPVRGVNFLSASAGINIPLYFWSKQKRKVQQKELELESARRTFDSRENTLKLGVSRLFYSLVRYQEEVQLYQTAILPQARQSLESARSAYQVDKVDFLTLLNNQVTLYDYEIAYHQALSSYFITVARLEEMVGRPLLEQGE